MGVVHPNYAKYLFGKYLPISKKTCAPALAVEKIDFSGPVLGRLPGE